jgi:hypothetical protein
MAAALWAEASSRCGRTPMAAPMADLTTPRPLLARRVRARARAARAPVACRVHGGRKGIPVGVCGGLSTRWPTSIQRL